MGVSVVFKAIKAKRLQVDAIRQELLNELRKEGTVHKQKLRQTVAPWKGEKPKFETLIGLTRKEGATAITGPVGSTNAVSKFEWLDLGTKKRWALMSSDWKSKTRVGVFKSGPGRGRVVIAGRRAMQARGIPARPGIKARGWTEKLAKQRKKPFRRRMLQAMKKASRSAFK